MTPNNTIERLAAKLHDIYMKEAHRQNDVRHVGRYEDLEESTKDYDRVLAIFIMRHCNPKVIDYMLLDDLSE